MNDATVVVTDDLLNAGKSDRSGWSKLQLMCIGIPWPPPKGWKGHAVGQPISADDADRFLQLRNGKNPAQKTDLPGHLQTGPFVCKRCSKELPFDSFEDSPKKDRIKKAICRSCCRELSKEAKSSITLLRQLGPKTAVEGKNYKGRNMWLNLLGFNSYREYLASPLWKEIRKRVF